MPRRSIWKGSFLDAFLLRKFFFYSPTPDEFEASGAFFEDFLPLSLKGEGGGFDLVEAPPRSPGNSGSGGPLPSFLEEHEVTSFSIERNARKNVVNSPQNPRINSGK